jgi:hypothetical protein
MAKVLLPKRFAAKDIERWQKVANKETRGNLSLWMDIVLNKAADKVLGVRKKQVGSNNAYGRACRSGRTLKNKCTIANYSTDD